MGVKFRCINTLIEMLLIRKLRSSSVLVSFAMTNLYSVSAKLNLYYSIVAIPTMSDIFLL